jgi:hypothetical protein
VVWYLSIALGVLAGLINLPIDEQEIRRVPAAAYAAEIGEIGEIGVRVTVLAVKP